MNNFLNVVDWNIQEMTGYEPHTTLYVDFGIAEKFGDKAVRDTYKQVMKAMKKDYVYLTELVMVLNWKIWEHYQTNEPLARIYDALWREAAAYACNNLKGDELAYYYRTTD